MFSDLELLESDPFKGNYYDVCIFGSGPAGMSLALNLPKKLRVLLIEGGDTEYSDESQNLYHGKNIGHDYFDLSITRLRFLGGSSNHWGGLCRPLDEVDFKSKSYENLSGWPINKKDLDVYLNKTKSILDIPDEVDLGMPDWLSQIQDSGELKEVTFWHSEPTRFAGKYRGEIESSKNIDCYINANLTDLRLDDSGRVLNIANIKTYSNKEYEIRAKSFVLAAGGLENPRILLNCNSQNEKGLGNDRDLVGRYFCEHPHFFVGDFVLEDSVRDSVRVEMQERNEWRHFRFLAPTEKEMLSRNMLNFGIRFQPRFIESKDSNKNFKDKMREIICKTGWSKEFVEWVTDRNIVCASDGNSDGTLMVAAEQSLNYSSRVRLSNDADAFGLKRIDLDWQLTDADKNTLKQAALTVGEVLAKTKVGRVKPRQWLMSPDSEFPGLDTEQIGGHHHMCTTRMSDLPEYGVVDKNLKVHGIDNLYIAGSSSFGSTGHVNPTFTIVQLSLRLADHLGGLMLK